MSQEVVLRTPGRCKRDAHFNTVHGRAILESSLTSRSSGSCEERTIFPKALENIGKKCQPVRVFNHTHATEGTGSRRGAAPPLLTGLHGPGSMAARSFFPADRPSEELSLLASFLGVLPAE